MKQSRNDLTYVTKYFFQVVIVLGVPFGYIIYKFIMTGYTYFAAILSVFLYLLIALNVKKGYFFDDVIIIYFPFKFFNRRKKIAYSDVTKVKRGGSYYESESLVINFTKNGMGKKTVLGYPSEKNKVGIVEKLKLHGIHFEEP